MRKVLQNNFFVFFVFLFLITPKFLLGQGQPGINPDLYDTDPVTFYNWFHEAWEVKPGTKKSWQTPGIWREWKKDNGFQDSDNIAPTTSKNRVFIEITETSEITVDYLDYKNLTYLWICGKLTIAEFVLVPPPVFESDYKIDEDPVSIFNITSCFNTGESISSTGFYFAPNTTDYNTSDLDQWFWVPVINDCDSEETRCCFSLDGINFSDFFPDGFDLTGVSSIKFVAFAEVSLGGFSQESIGDIGIISLNGGSGKNTLMNYSIATFSGKNLIEMNNLRLRICQYGELNVDHLIAGNGSVLNINGTFNVGVLEVGNNVEINVGATGILNAVEIITGTGGKIYNYGVINIGNGGLTMANQNCIINYESGTINLYPTNPIPDDYLQLGNQTGADCLGEGELPIELLSFTPQVNPDRINLNWTTGTEINNDYFTIERSRDLYGWEVLGFVPGAGNSSVPISYSFSDMRPLDGLAYYRLKQTDFDGKFEYFGPIAANYDFGLEGLEFKVMKQFSNWIIAVPNDGVYNVEVYNLQGHRLASEKVENNLVIPAPQGAVVIRVTDGFARSASRVVM